MIGTVAWFQRWAAPLCVAGLGFGAVVGASIWRFQDYPELARSRVVSAPASTVTVTTTPPLGDLSKLEPVTVERTATATVTKTATPERAMLQAVAPRAETRTIEAEAETVTETATVTKTKEVFNGKDPQGDKRDAG